MHTDPDGIVHPVTLRAEVESADVHYVSCEACGARWAGPFQTPAMAARVAELANADAFYDLPNRCRTGALGPCCTDGVPVEDDEDVWETTNRGTLTSEPDDDVPFGRQALHVAAGFGKGAVIAAFLLYQVARTVVMFVIGALRFLGRLGWWSLVVALAVGLVVKALSAVMPGPGTLVPVTLWGLGVLTAGVVIFVLGRRVLADLRAPLVEPAPEPTYSTPLTTARGGARVTPVGTTPADGKGQGETARAAGTRQP